MEHRIANSLQIIAGILYLKARAAASEKTRHELQDAHKRVMSVAAVQSHLHAVEGIEQIDIGAYLSKLAGGLAASMTGPQHSITIDVAADHGTLPTSQAVSMGLIVTELVINAIKYAFPATRKGARILITFRFDRADWKLTVADNGVGKTPQAAPALGSGLGTAILDSLTMQLGAQIQEVSTPAGLCVAVTHASFASDLPMAA
jgi:chemotaxis protein methyltransferase CheR